MSHGKGLLIFFAIVAVALIALKPHTGALQRAQSDDVTVVSDDDPIMQAAFQRARNTLDEFLALSAAPKPNTDSYAVKVAISHLGRTEYSGSLPLRKPETRSPGGSATRLNTFRTSARARRSRSSAPTSAIGAMKTRSNSEHTATSPPVRCWPTRARKRLRQSRKNTV